MKRWFIFPRQALLPRCGPRKQIVSLVGSVGNLVPGLVALLALLTHRASAMRALAGCLALFAAGYAFCTAWYLKRRTPLRRWPLLLWGALVTPWHILAILLGDAKVEWRGQQLRIARGGGFAIGEIWAV
jgi:ceramide glucosyltransferase